MKKSLFKKTLVLIIVVLFIGTSFVTSISGDIGRTKNIFNTVFIGNKGTQKNFFVDPPEEEWNKTFGGVDDDRGYSVQQTSDGGYIVAGYTNSFGVEGSDVWLVKTDANGCMLWSKTYNYWFQDDAAYSVQQTSDGGYIAAGVFATATTKLFSLLKLDAGGFTEWSKYWGEGGYDQGAYSVQQTSDGGYIAAGYGPYGYGYNFQVIKTDANGNTQWEKKYGEWSGDEVAYCVRQTADGGYIIVGSTTSMGASQDLFLVKIDEDGNMIWRKAYGGSYNDVGYSVQQTSDGGYIVAGYTNSFGVEGSDVWLVKTDANGTMMWYTTYGGTYDDVAYSLDLASDGGYIMVGYTQSYGAGDEDIWLIKTDSNGNMLWNKTFGGILCDMGRSVQQTSDGGYIIAGYTYSYGSDSSENLWLIKVSPEGSGNHPPVADAGGPYSGFVGEEIVFDASGSYDVDGDTLEYRWDFNNDGTWDTDWLSDPTIGWYYSNEYHGKIELEIRDDKDARDNDTADVNVSSENQPPTVKINFPENGNRIAGNITILGNATDDRRVELVEVKIVSKGDDPEGYNWIVATGTSSWSYNWNTTSRNDSDEYIIYARSKDDEDAYSDVYSITVNVNNAYINGIDVSHHNNENGKIDWEKVKNSGNIFAFVKATGATGFVDDYLDDNMQNGSNVNMLMGVYHFAYPEYNDPETEAKHFYENASNYLKPGYLRPVLDLENDEDHNSFPWRLGNPALSKWVQEFINAVEDETGVQPILYTFVDYAENWLNSSLNQTDLWIADYSSDPPRTGNWSTWDFWQYSDTGSVAGIVGDVDLDVFNGDMARLKTFLITDLEIGPILGLIGIKTTVKNNGDGDTTYSEVTDGIATDIEWSIKIEGGNIFWPSGGVERGVIDELKAGNTASISTFVFGFGKVTITVEVSSPNGSDIATTSAFVIGPFVLIVEQ